MNWKAFEHLWEVSSSGLVRNTVTKRPLTIRLRRDGYLDVKLNYKRYLVHRLVAILFVENPNESPQVNHKDGNRANANVNNLEWVTQFQNMKHAVDTGLFPNREGAKNGRSTLNPHQVLEIRRLLAEGRGPVEVSRRMATTVSIVSNIKRGRTWTSV